MAGTRFTFVMPGHPSASPLPGGGAEVQAWLFAKELARRGFDVHYISPHPEYANLSARPVDDVQLHWTRPRSCFKWLNAGALARTLYAIRPTIVVQRMASVETGIISCFCRWTGRSFVWICTGDEIPQKWHFWRREWRNNSYRSLKFLKRPLLLIDAVLADIAFRYGVRRATHCFSQNPYQHQSLLEHFARQSSTIVTGHETPRAPLCVRDRWSQRKVLWVGNLGGNKQPHLFVQLASALAGEGVSCFLIGSHSNKAHLTSLLENAPKNISYMGQLPFDETLTHFDTATLFINTSRSEGFPNTFVQAWLRGVPVLTLGIDPDSTITKRGTGLVCDSVDKMAKATLSLLNDFEAYKSLSNAAAAYALATHSIECAVDRFLESLSQPTETR